MELGILFILIFIACIGGTFYFGIKAIVALLDILSPEEPPDDDSDRDITIHVEITGLPKLDGPDQEQPRPSSTEP